MTASRTSLGFARASEGCPASVLVPVPVPPPLQTPRASLGAPRGPLLPPSRRRPLPPPLLCPRRQVPLRDLRPVGHMRRPRARAASDASRADVAPGPEPPKDRGSMAPSTSASPPARVDLRPRGHAAASGGRLAKAPPGRGGEHSAPRRTRGGGGGAGALARRATRPCRCSSCLGGPRDAGTDPGDEPRSRPHARPGGRPRPLLGDRVRRRPMIGCLVLRSAAAAGRSRGRVGGVAWTTGL